MQLSTGDGSAALCFLRSYGATISKGTAGRAARLALRVGSGFPLAGGGVRPCGGDEDQVALQSGLYLGRVASQHHFDPAAGGSDFLDFDTVGRLAQPDLIHRGVARRGELDDRRSADGDFDGQVAQDLHSTPKRTTSHDGHLKFLDGDEMPVRKSLHHVFGRHRCATDLFPLDHRVAFQA